ncbi:MAG: hypothetical protein WA771_09740 [Chthoniobacterales bacterium]
MKIQHSFPILSAMALALIACEPEPTLKKDPPVASPSPTPELAERFSDVTETAKVTLQEVAEDAGIVAERAGEIAKDAGAAAAEAGKDAMQSMRELADDVTKSDAEREVPGATPAENVEPTPAAVDVPTAEPDPTAEPTPTVDPIGS